MGFIDRCEYVTEIALVSLSKIKELFQVVEVYNVILLTGHWLSATQAVPVIDRT
ncbi:hypothetical protein D3C80_1939560 [compost metagenome]